MNKGKLIVVEGTDGSGKTVQTGLLTERLSKEGYQVQMTDFPQYGKSFFANMMNQAMLSSEIFQIKSKRVMVAKKRIS